MNRDVTGWFQHVPSPWLSPHGTLCPRLLCVGGISPQRDRACCQPGRGGWHRAAAWLQPLPSTCFCSRLFLQGPGCRVSPGVCFLCLVPWPLDESSFITGAQQPRLCEQRCRFRGQPCDLRARQPTAPEPALGSQCPQKDTRSLVPSAVDHRCDRTRFSGHRGRGGPRLRHRGLPCRPSQPGRDWNPLSTCPGVSAPSASACPLGI